jgi:hypothetical protein
MASTTRVKARNAEKQSLHNNFTKLDFMMYFFVLSRLYSVLLSPKKNPALHEFIHPLNFLYDKS